MADFSHVRLLAFDLDGTLLPRSKALTARTLEALRSCREKGLLLAFVTDRTREAAAPYLEAVEPDAAVLSYGAHILIHGVTAYRRFMSPAVADRVLSRVKDARCLRCQTEDGKRYTCSREEAGCLPLDPSRPMTRRLDHLCAWDLPADTARRTAREAGCSLSQLCGSRWCNFAPYGCSKENGMRRAFRALGLPPGTGIGFGDEDCDLGFFRVCGMGVAMANADPETLAGAVFVTGSCEEDGVAAFLERDLLA